MRIELFNADCLEAMQKIPDNSVDSIVTDPPYGLSFMGKKWDYDVPSEEIWAECLRVLKPGGHLLAFAGTRTQHRMAVRIEDAGFEIRDMLAWVYGSGFPKGHNLKGKWSGWSTALKPALEPITLARKTPISTIAENVTTYSTGAINIDGCRVGRSGNDNSGWSPPGSNASVNRSVASANYKSKATPDNQLGRWPANILHDGSDEVIGLFSTTSSKKPNDTANFNDLFECDNDLENTNATNSSSAARFFYCAKASKKDRDEGLELFNAKLAQSTGWSGDSMPLRQDGTKRKMPLSKNNHPTVKPTELMRYLCRLVTPPGGTVLDPFMGSGSTGKAANLEGFSFIGIERELEYFKIAEARVNTIPK